MDRRRLACAIVLPRDQAAPGERDDPVARRALPLALFILAGLFEIGGGYLVWRWWRDGGSWALGAAGAIILALYGVVPRYQPAHFGRVYAACGGVFVVMSVAWGWAIGGVRPDRFDLVGVLICLAGVAVIMDAPR